MNFAEDFSIIELFPRRLNYSAEPSVFVKGRVFCSLSFRVSGQIEITGGQQLYHITPQSIFYMPSGYDYVTKVMRGGEMCVIHFWAEGNFPREPFVWHPKEPQVYEKLFCQIVDNFPPGRRRDLASMGAFYRLLAKLRLDSQPESIRIPKRMQQAREMIRERFDDSTLSVAELARETGLSEVYFRREFKECFGCQPVAYISNIRIEHAKALLEAGDRSVSEVAIQSGYDNVSYFSYRFRCITGLSPSQYRENATQK